MSEEIPSPNAADAVLTITLYKADPHCIEYRFEVKNEFAEDDPEHVEQLNVVADIVNKYKERAEKAALHSLIQKKRELRRAQSQYFAAVGNKGEVPN